MAESQRSWLAGLRRACNASGALARWVSERGVTGAVWTPSSYEIDDVAEAIERLIASGAPADAQLLWDLAVEDVRAAADVLAPVFRASGGRDGYVAVWLDPAKLADPERAVRAARELVGDVRRANVAAALTWTPNRTKIVEAIVGVGAPVAVSGVADAGGRDEVAAARIRGVENLREALAHRPDPPAEVPNVAVFLLGDSGEDSEGVFPASLVTDLGLYSPHAPKPRVPVSPDAEQAGLAKAVAAVAVRGKQAAHDDGYAPEPFEVGVTTECRELTEDDVLADVWSRDYTVWSEDDPTEIADRLGWLDVPLKMQGELADLTEFARKTRAGGNVANVVLCGMGGSSLAPATFRSVLSGGVPLTLLDTTDPDHIAGVTSSLDLERTLFVISSKSGTTIETRAQLEHFWSLKPIGDRYVAITDPGSELAGLAAQRGFSKVFENPPDIGGRFSGLSYFGLVPSALCGVDLEAILAGVQRAIVANGPSVASGDAPGVRLGAALAHARNLGRDKLTIVLPRPLAALGPWLEQLIAESTGKMSTGLLPVLENALAARGAYGPDRVFCVYSVGDQPAPPQLEAFEGDFPVIRIRVPGPDAIGAEMYRWEVAIAIVGYLLDINPFDQPDVEAAKQATKQMLAGGARPDPGSATELLDALSPPSYVALQAFLTPDEGNERRLEALSIKLRDKLGVAVTYGFGPRYLHSTGQFHKGGPPTGVFVQLTKSHAADIEVPGMGFSFGRLFDAQADGDLQALRDAGRPAARTSLEALDGWVTTN